MKSLSGANVRCRRCGQVVSPLLPQCPGCHGPLPRLTQPSIDIGTLGTQSQRVANHRDYTGLAELAVHSVGTLVLLEYTLATVRALDTHYDLTYGMEGAAPTAPQWDPPPELSPVLLSHGCVLGEIVRRRWGGAWVEDHRQPDNLQRVAVVLPTGSRFEPFARVWRRLKNGSRDSLWLAFQAFVAQMPPLPDAEELPGWLSQVSFFDRNDGLHAALPFIDQALSLARDPDVVENLEIARGRAMAARAEREAPLLNEARLAPPAAPMTPAEPAAEAAPDSVHDHIPRESFTPGGFHARRAHQYATEGRHDEALRDWQLAISAGKRTVPVLLGLAVSLGALGRHGQALECIRNARGLDIADPVLRLREAAALRELGRWNEAEELEREVAFDQELRVSLSNRRRAVVNAYLARREAAYRNDGTDPLVAPFSPEVGGTNTSEHRARFVQQSLVVPTNEASHARALQPLELARRLMGDGLYREALPQLTRATELDPTYAEAWTERARCQLLLGRAAAAIALVTRAISLSPFEGSHWFVRGQAEDAIGHDSEAARAMLYFLALEWPVDRAAHDQAQEVLSRCEASPVDIADLGLFDDFAAPLVARQQGLAPDKPIEDAWIQLGRGFAKGGRSDLAEHCFGKAVQCAPERWDAWHLRGVVRAGRGALAAAISAFARSLALEPRSALGWWMKGDAEHQYGQSAAARISYQRYLELSSGEPEARVAKAREILAQLRRS